MLRDDSTMSDEPSPTTTGLRPGMLVLIAASLAAVVFIPALSGGWIYDDHALIGDNPFVHSFDHWTRWFTHDFWDVNQEIVRFAKRMIYWRPLVTVTYGLDWQLGGGSPLIFHISHTLWQALMGGLAFVVLRRWIGSSYPALAAAVLFSVHPTKAESVAWISGRTDVLCMIALLVASTGIARRLAGKRDGIALEVVATAVAYLCKEQAIVLPAFAAIEAWVAAGRPAIDSWMIVKRIIKVALPQAIVAIVYFVVRAKLMPIAAATGAAPLPIWEHTQSVLDSLGRFFTLTAMPHNLSIQHGLVHVANGELLHSLPYMLVGGIGLSILLAGAVLARRRFPAATMGIAFFLVTLAPTSNIIYTQMKTLVSERFLYVPIFGLALIVGAALARLGGLSRRTRALAYGPVIAICLALSGLAMARAADNADEAQFWNRELALHPESKEAHQYLVGRAIRDKEFFSALAVLLDMKQNYDRFDPLPQYSLEIAVQVAELSARVIPDHDTKSLRAIDDFAKELLTPGGPAATLELSFIRFGMSTASSIYASELRRQRFRLLALRSGLATRMGDDAQAIDLAAAAASECAECIAVVTQQALVLAVAGRYDDAMSVLDRVKGRVHAGALATIREHVTKARDAHANVVRSSGPAQLQARASELAALELWGPAYDVLAPYKEQIRQAPGVARGFAELAFRAGESAVAREVLSGIMPTSDIDEAFAEWTERMGWKR